MAESHVLERPRPQPDVSFSARSRRGVLLLFFQKKSALPDPPRGLVKATHTHTHSGRRHPAFDKQTTNLKQAFRGPNPTASPTRHRRRVKKAEAMRLSFPRRTSRKAISDGTPLSPGAFLEHLKQLLKCAVNFILFCWQFLTQLDEACPVYCTVSNFLSERPPSPSKPTPNVLHFGRWDL